MPIQSCSHGYQGSNLVATARQWVLVAPIDGVDGGEDADLGLKAHLEGRRVRLVEGLLDGLGELVEVAKIVVLLEAVEPGCVAREERQIVDVGVDPCGGMPSSGGSLGFSPSSSLLESPTSKPTRLWAGIVDPAAV